MKLEDIVLLIEEVPNVEDPSAGLWYWSVITFDEFMEKFGDGNLSEVIQGLFLTRDHSIGYYGRKKISGFDEVFIHDSRKYRCRFFSNIYFVKEFVINEIPSIYFCEGEDKGYDTAEKCKNCLLELGIDLDNIMFEADKEREEEGLYGRSIRNILLVKVSKENDKYKCILTEEDYLKKFITKNYNVSHEEINVAVSELYKTKFNNYSQQKLDCCYRLAYGRTERFSVEARFCANKSELGVFMGGIWLGDKEHEKNEEFRFAEDECSKELRMIL